MLIKASLAGLWRKDFAEFDVLSEELRKSSYRMQEQNLSTALLKVKLLPPPDLYSQQMCS